MKKQSSIISLILVLVIWFGMAFKCANDNTEPREGGAGRRDNTTTTTRGDAPTTADVQQAIQKWIEASETQYDQNSTTVIELDTTPRIGSPNQRYDKKAGNATFYPVKVDFTATVDGPSRITITHYTGGIFDFYKDEYGEWHFVNSVDYKITKDPASHEKF